MRVVVRRFRHRQHVRESHVVGRIAEDEVILSSRVRSVERFNREEMQIRPRRNGDRPFVLQLPIAAGVNLRDPFRGVVARPSVNVIARRDRAEDRKVGVGAVGECSGNAGGWRRGRGARRACGRGSGRATRGASRGSRRFGRRARRRRRGRARARSCRGAGRGFAGRPGRRQR